MIGTYNEQYKEYKMVQKIDESDCRGFDDRLASLPFVRDEDLPEWEEWANRAFPEAHRYVNNHR
jgi:hypothetical protein